MIIGGYSVGGIGLGTAQLAFKDVSVEQAVATIHAAVDSGITLLDTALAYTRPGAESFAEAVVAKALGSGAAAYCAQLGIAYLAYSPLRGTGDVAAVRAVADRHGVSPQRVRLAWLLAQGPHVAALVGSSRPETIVDSAAAAGLRLDEDDLRRLG